MDDTTSSLFEACYEPPEGRVLGVSRSSQLQSLFSTTAMSLNHLYASVGERQGRYLSKVVFALSIFVEAYFCQKITCWVSGVPFYMMQVSSLCFRGCHEFVRLNWDANCVMGSWISFRDSLQRKQMPFAGAKHRSSFKPVVEEQGRVQMFYVHTAHIIPWRLRWYLWSCRLDRGC